ncbi:ATP-binding cassette domain-containing protein [Intrasporangium sp.]|uniref:iron ABC transporter ATP-binding protein n=1 Tax=Intrasporangium sp. TaxID=1925024 RepID=UPI0032220A42
MITIQNVTKAYGGTVVVDGVSLELPRGGVTSLVGPNGAGKSTLLSMMSRLLTPDSGAVLLDGLDVARAPGRQVARRLAVLRQENHLTVRLTVRDLVTFGRFPHSKGRPTLEDIGKVDEALGRLGLLRLADRFLDELSGGQRQRACVAMVLAQGTDYVLLDEPLNNLDMRHAAAMMRNLRSAADELQRTVVLVVHDINAASVYSDHIVALRDGRVVAQGTPRQIMRPELLEEVFGVPIRVERIDGHLVGHHFIPCRADPALAVAPAPAATSALKETRDLDTTDRPREPSRGRHGATGTLCQTAGRAPGSPGAGRADRDRAPVDDRRR